MERLGTVLIWFLVFFTMTLREGKRAKSDKPFSRLLRRFYEICMERAGKSADEEGEEKP